MISTVPTQNRRSKGTSTDPKIAKAKKRAASRAVTLPKTFRKKSVEDAFVHFLQLTCPEYTVHDELALLAKQLQSQSIEFIHSDLFAERSAESQILGDEFLVHSSRQHATRASKAPSMPAHLARLCETVLLTPEEEKSLFQRMNYLRYRAKKLQQQIAPESPDSWTLRRVLGLLKASDWYRDRIVQANMRLVISIIKKYVNTHNAFDDLLSDGIVALIRAVEKFDTGFGFRFSTYATQVLRRNTYRTVMENQKERLRHSDSLLESGIEISDEQKQSSISEQRWHELQSKLSVMLDQLDRREKLIIRARFSLGAHRRIQTLQSLADKLGVSKERIRQLEKRALDKLRGMVVTSPLPES